MSFSITYKWKLYIYCVIINKPKSKKQNKTHAFSDKWVKLIMIWKLKYNEAEKNQIWLVYNVTSINFIVWFPKVLISSKKYSSSPFPRENL